jgi:hypothetical protein
MDTYARRSGMDYVEMQARGFVALVAVVAVVALVAVVLIV